MLDLFFVSVERNRPLHQLEHEKPDEVDKLDDRNQAETDENAPNTARIAWKNNPNFNNINKSNGN